MRKIIRWITFYSVLAGCLHGIGHEGKHYYENSEPNAIYGVWFADTTRDREAMCHAHARLL